MATNSHQKNPGTAKRSGKTLRTRSLAAVLSGATLGGVLAAGGALGLIGSAGAATTLSGATFVDLNDDGQFTPNIEPQFADQYIPNVAVTAFGIDGSVVGTTRSAANGTWSIVTSAAGPFRVEFSDLPANTYYGFNPRTVDLQLPADGNTTNVNFGLYAKINGLGQVRALTDNEPPEAIQLGDRVWNDRNGNGIQDVGEIGIPGVLIELLVGGSAYTDVNNAPVTATTDQNGNYIFRDLLQSTSPAIAGRPYSMRIAAGQGALNGFTVTTTKSSGSTVQNDNDGALAAGFVTALTPAPRIGANMTYDFGFVPSARQYCIGDQVWNDANKNGILDTGSEAGVSGVRVILVNADGSDSATSTVTSDDGSWRLCGFPNGNYRVRFVKPAGFDFTTRSTGPNAEDRRSSADPATGISFPGGVTDGDCRCIDAGLVPVAQNVLSLGDYVWLDVNRNGIQDSGDTPISGAKAELLDATGAVVATQTTGTEGKYLFTGLAAGNYRVRFTRPTGSTATPTQSKQGTDDAVDSDAFGESDSVSLTGVINLTANTLNVDAGWVAPVVVPVLVSLGDYVWLDANGNGIQDNASEAAVLGAKVELLDSTGAVIATQTTKADGKYLFPDLRQGNYRVRFTRPVGSNILPTASKRGTDDIVDSDGIRESDSVSVTGVINLTATNLNVDAGWVAPETPKPSRYCLGDLVFDDVNSNGARDANEPGVGNVIVNVFDGAGNSVGQRITKADGSWSMCDLAPGVYSITVVRPSGYDFTTQGSGNNLSNVNPSTGKSNAVTITNADITTLDAGLRLIPIVVVVVTPDTVPTTTVPAPTTTVPAPTTTTTTVAPVRVCIGDKVFVDATGTAKDGIGIAGVTITLVKPDGTTSTATTDATGKYTFCSLVGGTYTVKVNAATLPTGAIATYDLSGRKINETSVALSSQDNNDVDFGYKLGDVKVLPEVIVPDPIAYTGSNSTTMMLYGFASLLIGLGLAGLFTDRRRSAL